MEEAMKIKALTMGYGMLITLICSNAFAFKDGSYDGWCSIAACQKNTHGTYDCHTGANALKNGAKKTPNEDNGSGSNKVFPKGNQNQ